MLYKDTVLVYKKNPHTIKSLERIVTSCPRSHNKPGVSRGNITSWGGGIKAPFVYSSVRDSFISQKYRSWSLYHFHIWWVSPQLSCGYTAQIWPWYAIGIQCFDNGEKSGKWRKGEIILIFPAAWVSVYQLISLEPSDAIWRWRSWSTLVQVMACCLTAPSHYLKQCWLIISKV